MERDELHRRLEFAVDLAWKAGRITLARFQTGGAVEWKADRTPVTETDRATEAFCRRAIAAAWPGEGILGEELGTEHHRAPHRWIIDPIDGTISFIRGVPLYAVLIALESPRESAPAGPTLPGSPEIGPDAGGIDRISSVGVIHFPALGETVAAARGLGCTWNGRKARVSEVGRLDEAWLLTTDPRNPSGPAWNLLAGAARTVRTWGDAYGHALVATGRAEAMWDPMAALWDSAALQVVIEEAGGVFTTTEGRAVHDGGSALSTNAALSAEVRETIQAALRTGHVATGSGGGKRPNPTRERRP